MPNVSVAQVKSAITKMAKGKRMKHRKRQLTLKSNFDKFIYPYKQYVDSALLTGGNASITANLVGSYYAWQFTLAMLPQYNQFIALYDEYRIRQVEFTIRPRASVNVLLGGGQGLASSTGAWGNIIVAIDTDDANAPASYNALREYGSAKEHELVPGKKIVKTFRPAVAAIVYNNGITFGGSERYSPWIDCANTGVPHYGIKLAMPPAQVNNLFTADITVRYLIEFRQVR